MKKLKDNYHFYAWITISAWATSFIFTRLALREIDYTTLGLLRNGIAFVTLVILILLFRITKPQKSDLPQFFFAGIIGFFIYIIVFNKGVTSVTAATSSVILATVPILTALVARIFLREKLKNYQWIAIVIEFVGILILSSHKGHLEFNRGIFWLLLSALLFSFYNIIQKRLTKDYNAYTVSAFSILLGTLPAFIILPTRIPQIVSLTPITFLAILSLGIASSSIAYITWTKAFSLAKNTSQVSNYMFITPILTTILGVKLIHEIPDLSFSVGACVIFSGLVLFNRGHIIFHKRN